MRLIIYPDVDIWNFVLSGIEDREDTVLYPLNRYCNVFHRIVRRLPHISSVPSEWVMGSVLRREITKLKDGDTLLLCEYTESPLVSGIASIIPSGVRLNLWLWNHKGSNSSFIREFGIIRSCGYQTYTYDAGDAIRHGLVHLNQFFCIRKVLSCYSSIPKIDYDFFFVGYNKNRADEISRISKLLSNYLCNFTTIYSASDYIPYEQYIEQASHSRCIVEILARDETASTLRPLEALALHRKLITNNVSICNFSFYCPENIFIIDGENLDQLPIFLSSPFKPLPAAIVDSFDVNCWLRSFQ